MSKEQLTPLQNELLNMLKWFDNFCRSNNLQYFSIGGTLLGAVRHKGFIPWDDDIDVAMPRPDYERLIKLMKDSIFDHYILETPRSDNADFCYPYCKLYDVNTTLIEHYNPPLVRGIFLDVFPLDCIGQNKEQGLTLYKKINRNYNFYLTRVAALREERSNYKNFAIIISQLIPNFIINNRSLRVRLDEMCSKQPFDFNCWGGNLLGNWGIKEIMPLSLFKESAEYQFEDMKVLGVKNYDKYLSYVYGDWRKLPPKEKQISHHDFVKLDLNSSYSK